MRRLDSWIIVAAVFGVVGPLAADDDQLPRELQELLSKQNQQNRLRAQVVQRQLREARPLEVPLADSLNLRGDGLGRLTRAGWGDDLTSWPLQLENGRLHVTSVQDFEVLRFQFHLDASHDFTQELKRLKAQAEEMKPWLPKLPADWRQRSELWREEINRVRGAADLALVDLLTEYRFRLKGDLALQPAQLERLRAAAVRRQALAEELGRLAVQPNPDAASRQRLAHVYGEFGKSMLFAWREGDLFTAEQRRALGFDPDPNAPPRPARGVTAAASSSAGGGTDDDGRLAEQLAAQEKEQARLEAEIKAQRAAAQVKFVLKGRDAQNWSEDIPTAAGLLRVWIDDANAEGAAFTFYLDDQKTWAVEKARRLREYESWTANLKGQEAQNARKAFERYKQELDAAPNQFVADWGAALGRLKGKTGAVPPEVQQRFDHMIAEMTQAADALTAAYRLVLEKLDDEQSQQALFVALRSCVKAGARSLVLQRREEYDPDGTRTDLPWLLSMDQVDLINQGQLTTGSSVSSGPNGTVSIRMRPVGKKQYVAVSAEKATLGELIETVQRTARKYYHNHKLQLKVTPEAADKPVRGLVEGKSAEELFQSLALRAGVALEKDKNTPHGWLLKP